MLLLANTPAHAALPPMGMLAPFALLLLCIAVLLAATNTSCRTRLRLGGCSVLAIIVG